MAPHVLEYITSSLYWSSKPTVYIPVSYKINIFAISNTERMTKCYVTATSWQSNCTAYCAAVVSVLLFSYVFVVYIQYLCLILCVFKGPCARCVVEIVLKLESEHCWYFVFIVLYCLLQHTFQQTCTEYCTFLTTLLVQHLGWFLSSMSKQERSSVFIFMPYWIKQVWMKWANSLSGRELDNKIDTAVMSACWIWSQHQWPFNLA